MRYTVFKMMAKYSDKKWLLECLKCGSLYLEKNPTEIEMIFLRFEVCTFSISTEVIYLIYISPPDCQFHNREIVYILHGCGIAQVMTFLILLWETRQRASGQKECILSKGTMCGFLSTKGSFSCSVTASCPFLSVCTDWCIVT